MTAENQVFSYQLIKATTENEYVAARELFIEYAKTLNFNLCFQNFDAELAELHIMYHEPPGGIFLVKDVGTGEFVGCAGIRKFGDGIAELKRMYIREAHRGQGLGERLLYLSIDLARELNYEKIRLDTISTMKSAIKLYQGNGFKPIEPYRENPDPGALFFELEL
ncbi:MAG: GNAT family N-acetyltransferase [bacterium]